MLKQLLNTVHLSLTLNVTVLIPKRFRALLPNSFVYTMVLEIKRTVLCAQHTLRVFFALVCNICVYEGMLAWGGGINVPWWQALFSEMRVIFWAAQNFTSTN